MQTLQDFFQYFVALTEDRRAHPTDDLASVIANAELDGEPIGIFEAVGYYVIIATAGHDTTSSSIAGGLHALLAASRPARSDCATTRRSCTTAVDEMIRWVSPVKQFMRTATDDYVLRGVTIAGGRVGAAVVPVGEPRRGRVRARRQLRRRAQPEQARRVRLRRALLPRRAARPHGGHARSTTS